MQNPYDRRVDPRRRGMTPTDGTDYMPPRAAQDGRMRTEMERAGLTIDDVHAIAGQAYMRGRDDGESALIVEQQDELARARRVAWDEGKDAGLEHAAGELLRTYDVNVTHRMRALHAEAVQIIEADRKTKQGRELTTVAALLAFAKRVAVATDLAIGVQATLEDERRRGLSF